MLAASQYDIISLVRDIIAVEQPIHVKTLIDRVQTVYSTSRRGKGVRTRIEQAVSRLSSVSEVRREEREDDFLNLAGNTASRQPRRKGDRSIDRISPSEIDAGLLLVVRKTFGSERKELVRETARQFGWSRTGQNIDRRLNQGIDRLLEVGRLSLRADMLVAAEDRG